ncbi:hypothetical protein F5144DRAFT_587368 [Chaetomium tenue]|uniref:Uncharacterized protein n=1 Tax=Chaetomium tenue TaxID=1854479 RepID=A0ACB7NU40_9PEZI|nr:hypothetical protein F5144DRAFT_587368 [Chaetomium globosum]
MTLLILLLCAPDLADCNLVMGHYNITSDVKIREEPSRRIGGSGACMMGKGKNPRTTTIPSAGRRGSPPDHYEVEVQGNRYPSQAQNITEENNKKSHDDDDDPDHGAAPSPDMPEISGS